eukprot:3771429-Amphidinium_carterae.1
MELFEETYFGVYVSRPHSTKCHGHFSSGPPTRGRKPAKINRRSARATMRLAGQQEFLVQLVLEMS